MNSLNTAYTPKELVATGLVKKGGGVIGSFLVGASSSGTLTVYDGIDTSGTRLCNAVPLTAGSTVPFPASVRNGIYVVIGGTADITIFYS